MQRSLKLGENVLKRVDEESDGSSRQMAKTLYISLTLQYDNIKRIAP